MIALIAVAVVAVSFFISLKLMDWLSPRTAVPKAAQVELPPLPPMARASFVMAPVSIALAAHPRRRRALDARAISTARPTTRCRRCCRTPISAGPLRAEPIAARGAQDVLSLSTPLNGKLNVTGSLSAKATGAVGDAIGGLLGANAAKQIGSINIKAINANAEIKGSSPSRRGPSSRPPGASSRTCRRRCRSATPA